MIFGRLIASLKKKFQIKRKKKPSKKSFKKQISRRRLVKSQPKKAKPKRKITRVKKKVSRTQKRSVRSLQKRKPRTPSVKLAGKQKPTGILVGVITHYFSKIEVCVIKMIHGRIAVGQQIKVSGHKRDFTQEIKSLQIENSDVQSAHKGQLVGMKVNQKVKDGDKVYLSR